MEKIIKTPLLIEDLMNLSRIIIESEIDDEKEKINVEHMHMDMFNIDYPTGAHSLMSPNEALDYVNKWIEKQVGKNSFSIPIIRISGIELA